MERERNNTGLVIALTILAMLVVGLAGFIVYDKVIKNNEPNTEENGNSNNQNGKDKEVITSISVTSSLVTSLKFPTKEAPWEEWSYKNVKIDELHRDEKMHIAAAELPYKDEEYDPELSMESIKVYGAKLVEQKFKALFGPDEDYYNGNIENCGCCEIGEYNKNKNAYIAECGCGHDSPIWYDYVTKKYKAEQSDDYLYVYEYVQIVIHDGIEEHTYLSNSNYDEILIIDDEDYEDGIYMLMDEGKVDTYKWTFKKQSDGKYYFYSGAWEN